MKFKSLIGFCLVLITSASVFADYNLYMKTNWAIYPVSPVPGDNVTIGNVVKNDGDAVANITVEFGMDGIKISDRVFATIGAGAQKSMSFSWTATTPGPHEIYMKVDPANIVVETNENDNIATTIIQVASGAQPPDLNWNTSVTPSPLSPNAGENTGIIANFNLNTGTVNNLKVKATIDGSPVWEKIYPTVNVGSTGISFNWIAVEGSHQISVILDPDNTIVESYENNNETIYTINVKPPLPQEMNGPGDPSWDSTYGGSNNGFNVSPKAAGLMPGDTVSLAAKVRYSGSRMDNLKIRCGTGNKVLFQGGFTNLTDGIERSIAFDYKTPLSSGAKIKIYCQIDPDQNRNDTNRSNNLIETEIETVRMNTQSELGTSSVISDLGPCAIAGTASTDVEVTLFSFQHSANTKEKVKFSAIVKNNGLACISMLKWKINDAIGTFLTDGLAMPTRISKPNQVGGSKPDQWLIKVGETKTISGFIYKKDIKSECYRPTPTDPDIICPNIKFTIDYNNLINDPNRANNEKNSTAYFYTPS
jgi:hypothetical protein